MPKCDKNKAKTKKNLGGKYSQKKKRVLKTSYFSNNQSSSRVMRGNKKKKYTKNKRDKNDATKISGGACFGNGVGANINNPNYSIYNTNALKLFPYKP